MVWFRKSYWWEMCTRLMQRGIFNHLDCSLMHHKRKQTKKNTHAAINHWTTLTFFFVSFHQNKDINLESQIPWADWNEAPLKSILPLSRMLHPKGYLTYRMSCSFQTASISYCHMSETPASISIGRAESNWFGHIICKASAGSGREMRAGETTGGPCLQPAAFSIPEQSQSN